MSAALIGDHGPVIETLVALALTPSVLAATAATVCVVAVYELLRWLRR